ncbi:threonine synthase [Candidatus Woesearchaeota archaeon]|nr:threonine synthase [Candidatus Woesearchaeota archaeon]
MKEILYCSTNRNQKGGFREEIGFKDAFFMGLAPDNGLFMPTYIPKIPKSEILALKGKTYAETAFLILRKFLKHELSDKDLKWIIQNAYYFSIPIEKLDELTYLARMDHGPTASFKDFAAQFMAKLMYKLKPKNRKITILVATSGDTGSAIGEAFRGLGGIEVFILYPSMEVSSVQKKHMDTIGRNVRTIAVEGKFDDCQRLVKQAFADRSLKHLNLTSANSINIGRILPQIAYYFYIYAKIAENYGKIIFSIPSGNFGNSLGCEIARRMGLPVGKIIIAVNENDEFPRFLSSGQYEKIEPSKACISNAMNIGNPSNLARYFDLYKGNLDKDGIIHKMPNIMKMKENLFSVSITDEETIKTIKDIYKKHSIILEPHGAVGIAALNHYRKQHKKTLSVCMETADPAKFPEIIIKEIGARPKVPKSMKIIGKRKGKTILMGNDYKEFRKILLK